MRVNVYKKHNNIICCDTVALRLRLLCLLRQNIFLAYIYIFFFFAKPLLFFRILIIIQYDVQTKLIYIDRLFWFSINI